MKTIEKAVEACDTFRLSKRQTNKTVCGFCGHNEAAHIPHSKRNALASMDSIRKMVANLELETAARYHAEHLERNALIEVLLKNNDDETPAGFFEDQADDELVDLFVEAVTGKFADPEKYGMEFDEEAARERIQEDALSVQVRSDWYSPGDEDGAKPAEFEILLTTGGPALRIIGDLDEHGQPTRARMEHQDWGTPWQELFEADRDVLLTYAQQFYFGE